MNTLFPELIELIVNYNNNLSKFNLFMVSKLIQTICKKFIELNHKIALENFDTFSLMMTKNFDKFTSLDFKKICAIGHLPLINKFNDMKNHDYWNYGLRGACRGGHVAIINLMIEKGADDWDDGLFEACRGGNIDIVNLMIQKEVNFWDDVLFGACQGGNIDIVNLMIQKGSNDWDWGLFGACRKGHIDIVNLMIEKGANDLNNGLFKACEGGHINIINLMIEKGANHCNYCRKSMEEHLKQ